MKAVTKLAGGIMYFTISTQQNGDGSDPAYVVYFERRIVAIFPVHDPASNDAKQYATRFVDAMNGYYMRRLEELKGEAPKATRRSKKCDCGADDNPFREQAHARWCA